MKGTSAIYMQGLHIPTTSEADCRAKESHKKLQNGLRQLNDKASQFYKFSH